MLNDIHALSQRAKEKLRQIETLQSIDTDLRKALTELTQDYPELVLQSPGQQIKSIALTLLLLAPLVTDTILEQQAIIDLMARNNIDITNSVVRLLFSVLLVGVQTFAVWVLSLLGAARNGFPGLLIRVAGLLIATIVPVVIVSALLAEAQSHQPQAGLPASGWIEVITQNMQVIGLSFMSLALHLGIWTGAESILEAITGLVIGRRVKVLKRQIAANKQKIETAQKELEEIRAEQKRLQEAMRRRDMDAEDAPPDPTDPKPGPEPPKLNGSIPLSQMEGKNPPP